MQLYEILLNMFEEEHHHSLLSKILSQDAIMIAERLKTRTSEALSLEIENIYGIKRK